MKWILRFFARWGSGSLIIFVLYLQNKFSRSQKYLQGARKLLSSPPSSLGVRGSGSSVGILVYSSASAVEWEGKWRKEGSQSYPSRLNTTPRHCTAPGWPNPCQNSGIKPIENTNRPSRAAKAKLRNVNEAKPAQKLPSRKISDEFWIPR